VAGVLKVLRRTKLHTRQLCCLGVVRTQLHRQCPTQCIDELRDRPRNGDSRLSIGVMTSEIGMGSQPYEPDLTACQRIRKNAIAREEKH